MVEFNLFNRSMRVEKVESPIGTQPSILTPLGIPSGNFNRERRRRRTPEGRNPIPRRQACSAQPRKGRDGDVFAMSLAAVRPSPSLCVPPCASQGKQKATFRP